MSDYRIEKLRCPVAISLAYGNHLSGDVFVQPLARFHVGPQDPIDLMNDLDPFLPLAMPSGEVRLIQKRNIAIVDTPLPIGDEAMEAGVVGMRVEFTLIDGSSHLGSIFPELRMDRPRLVDYLNDTTHHFLALFTAEQLRLVNRAHIAYVRQVS